MKLPWQTRQIYDIKDQIQNKLSKNNTYLNLFGIQLPQNAQWTKENRHIPVQIAQNIHPTSNLGNKSAENKSSYIITKKSRNVTCYFEVILTEDWKKRIRNEPQAHNNNDANMISMIKTRVSSSIQYTFGVKSAVCNSANHSSEQKFRLHM